jgi:hypothetical protein
MQHPNADRPSRTANLQARSGLRLGSDAGWERFIDISHCPEQELTPPSQKLIMFLRRTFLVCRTWSGPGTRQCATACCLEHQYPRIWHNEHHPKRSSCARLCNLTIALRTVSRNCRIWICVSATWSVKPSEDQDMFVRGPSRLAIALPC